MRLKEKPLGFVINFFLGIAWAFVLIGIVTPFLYYFHNSLFDAVISAIIGAIPGLLMILFLEHIITVKEKHDELKKQTKLLEALLNEIQYKKKEE
ncbi:MAG: hypothetical protein ABXS92_00515 [Sulfurimonas sp.]